ncbi:MAG: TonB-dependent receptor [Bacteroidota bacterium]
MKRVNRALHSVPLLLFLLGSFSLTASTNDASFFIEITGTVVDEEGTPLIGVTVRENGTTSGTVTDLDGNFSLNASSADAVLIFSYTGFATQEVALNGRTRLDVTLETDVAQLDEIVVVGYGTQQKSDVTGSLSQVGGDDLIVAPTPNLSAGLAGKLSGVITLQTSGQPGFDDAAFQIRGRSTLGNNNPLILVDGVERSLSRINPFTIQSITALKDAASTAVYGSRAANGVLLVTTRRGSNDKPSFRFSANYGVQEPAGRPELMDANEYVIAFRQALSNQGVPNDQLPFGDILSQAQAGQLESFDWWNETLTNSAPQRQYNASVDGGTESLRYFFSYGHLDQEGFFDNAGFNQHEVRSNVDADIARGLTASIDLMGRLENRSRSADGDGEIFSNVLRANPLNPVFVDGRPGAEGLPPGSLGFDGFSGNSFGDANLNGSRTRALSAFNSNLQLNYDLPFLEGLSARALYSYDTYFSTERSFFTPYTTYQLNEATGEFIPLQSDNIRSLSETRNNNDQKTIQLSLRYKKQFGDHYLSGLALFERIKGDFNNLSAFRDGFISPVIPQFFAGNVINDENNGSASETARLGYVARVDYGYKNRYLFQANLRVDESYIFPPDTRRGTFPAFSLGWRISEEPFMAGIDWLGTLKVRGSWGITGNDRVGSFRFVSGFGFNGGYVEDGNFQQGIGPTGIANPNITWETATTTDIGLEASLWDGRFGFEVDYYQKRTEDILASRSLSVPLTFGAELPIENIGIVDSWGWEFSANHRNDIGKFSYKLNANLTLAENEIVFIDEPAGVNPATSITGKEIGIRIGYLSDGIYQNQAEIDEGPTQFGLVEPGDIRYRDINGRDANGNLTGQPDGKVDADDRTVIGESSTPNLIYGFGVNLGYEGFTLDLSFQGAGQYARNIAPRGFLLEVGNNFDVLNDSWTPDNPDARYPRILPDGNVNNNQLSDFFLENITFLRLRNARLSYDFAQLPGFLDRVGIDQFAVTLSATNLFTLTNVSIGDPEGNDGNALFYPISRVISIGANLGF